jgi:peroxiredoxin
MRKFPGLLSVAVLAITAFGAFAAGPVPRKAPEFVIQSLDGKQTLLSSYRGKDVVLALMYTTCPHCQKMAQTLSMLQTEYAGKGLQMLGATFNPDARRDIQQFDKLFAVNFPCGVASNENVMQFLQQTTPPFIPILVFIDRTGTIRAQHLLTGDEAPNSPEKKWFDSGEMGVRAEIEKLLKTAPAKSRSISQK